MPSTSQECPCGAIGPCANPNCHIRTGQLPGGAVVVAEFLRENGREEMAREVERIDQLRRLADAALEAMGGEIERLKVRCP